MGVGVVGLDPRCDTVVGVVLHPSSQLARFYPPKVPYISNIFIISPRDKTTNYRANTCPSFEVATHQNNLPLLLLLLLPYSNLRTTQIYIHYLCVNQSINETCGSKIFPAFHTKVGIYGNYK